jgi:DMSO/TMAO reductase YedYZ heme-binding membrane subunit
MGDSARRLWARAWIAAAAAVAFATLYFFVRQYLKDGLWRFDLTLINKSLGVASLFLVTLSMFLTGVAYFSWGSGRLLSYRRTYGLVGFWVGLSHGAVNHVLLAAAGLHPESGADARHAEAAGLAALIVFALMAVASSSRARERMGGKTWRKFLRYAGYAGLVLAAGHTALLKGASWAKYLRTFDPFLPSLSLPVAAFALAAIVLRGAVWISQRRKA